MLTDREQHRELTRLDVMDAFDDIRNGQLTLIQISRENIFPRKWVEILGLGTYPDPPAMSSTAQGRAELLKTMSHAKKSMR